jgi:RHS repeat-associated protein
MLAVDVIVGVAGGVAVAASRVALRTQVNEDPSTLYWILGDHLGSTAVTASSDGALYSEIRYTAFGEVRYSDGTTLTDYQYTGQRLEEIMGIYYYRARWYDPAIGRFMQADTMVPKPESPLALDRYAYANNNPLKYTDPSGHCIGVLAGVDTAICLEVATGVVIGGYVLWQYYYSPDADANRVAFAATLENSLHNLSTNVSSLISKNIYLARLDDRSTGSLKNVASHLSRMLGGESVGGFPGFEPPDPDDDDYRRKVEERSYRPRDVDDWVRDINKHLRELIARNPGKTLEELLQEYWRSTDPSLSMQEITTRTNHYLDSIRTVQTIAESQTTIGVSEVNIDILKGLTEMLGVVPW